MSHEVGDWGKLYGHKFHLCVNPIFIINAEATSKTKYIQPCFELPLKIRIKFYDIVCKDYRLRHIRLHFFFGRKRKAILFGVAYRSYFSNLEMILMKILCRMRSLSGLNIKF